MRSGGVVRGGGDARALEMMLDYAIVGGAALRLPLFVLLVRAARLELIDARDPAPGKRRSAKERDHSIAAAACRIAAASILRRSIETRGDMREASAVIGQEG